MSNPRSSLFAAMQPRFDACGESGRPLGAVLLRLLRLRDLNILLGYDIGEELMRASLERVADVLRPTDGIFRHGDSEIVLLLPDLISPNHALLAAHGVLRALQQPIEVRGHRLLANVAMGVAVCPEHASTPEMLCRHADMAFGEALRNGEHVAMYAPRESHLDVPYVDLRLALERGELEINLQPIIDLGHHRIVGAESLARWNSPRLGRVAPSVFISLAEQTGLIGLLTRWSINATLRHAAQMQLPQRGVHLSINLSPRVFVEHDFSDELFDALRIWDIPAASVMLEVTENAVMEDPVRSAAILNKLHDSGIRIAIDDFGVGNSSFTYLRQFPASELKIDQTFVLEMTRDTRTARLVGSMIDLAHRLDMQVVAEGVEDQATQDLLVQAGCDRGQGYHLGRPQTPEAFAELLRTSAATAPG